MNVKDDNTFKVKQLQNTLYQLAKKDIQSISNLYEKVYQLYILEEAWRQVKKYIGVGQIDVPMLKKVEAYGVRKLLDEIRSDLQFEAYKLKSINQEANDVDITNIKNIIVQMAVKIVIHPIFKTDFVTNSNTFRTRQKAKVALDNIIKSLDNKEYYVIKVQIKSYFDNVNQDKLTNLVEQRIMDNEMLCLIRRWMNSGTIYQLHEGNNHFGLDHSLVISPLLINIYLNALDKAWNNHPLIYGKWVRFADEITILCNNKENVTQALKLLQLLLASLDLELDPTKTEVVCNRYVKEVCNLTPTNPSILEDASFIYSNAKTAAPSPCEILHRKNVIQPEDNIHLKDAIPSKDIIQSEYAITSEDVIQSEYAITSEDVIQSEYAITSEDVVQSEYDLPLEDVIPSDAPEEETTKSFCGYKYRFGLYAAHSNVDHSDENIHYHTFTITLYIHAGSSIDDNFSVEKAIQDWLVPLQGKQLSQVDLFALKTTTIEGIGDTLYDALYDVVHQLGYDLIKLTIYENPIRVYSVSHKRLDSTVNEINDIYLDCVPILNFDDNIEDAENTTAPAEVKKVTEVENVAELLKVADTAEKATKIEEEFADSTYLQSSVQEALAEVAATLDVAAVSPDLALELPINKPKILLVILKCILGFGCFTALAILTMYIVKDSGKYPQGSDTFCHLYRADLLLKNIQQGNWFPLYDGTWYNGVEIMRYWGPLPLYLMAGLEWVIQSNILDTYVILLGVLLVIGGCGWLLWGITYRRIGLSVIIGLLWFYMPENMRVVILEGNLPRGVINALLPFFFFFLWRVVNERKKNAIFPLVFVTTIITLCHLGITLMLIATTILFIIFHTLLNHTTRSSLCAFGACISGVLLAGLWVVPALIGGAASGSSTNQVMKFFFESAFVSLNPFTRLSGDMLSFYFGLSIFIICVLGILLGPKNSKAGFITAVVLLICTTKSVYALFAKLPFSQFLWMIRFIPIGLAAAMVSFLLWRNLKKWAVLLLVMILAVDCATSYQNIYFPPEYKIANVQANLDHRAEEALITKAKEITKQRMALMDLSEYGSFAPYYITGVGNAVNYTYGAGWEGAGTAPNIVNLNAAVENGWYTYLFDRALELGNDTVLIPIDNLKEKTKDIDKLTAAAKISGYDPVENNGTSILFHKATTAQFGVISKYKDIAIGESASGIAMIFPCFEEGTNSNINEYTFEELRNYRTIYLSGFTYKDKASAEALLLKLAENGVNIYIDMNRIPMNEVKKSMELFGVTSQNISFSDSFPEFIYQGSPYLSLDFNYDVGEWNTVYLIGLDQIDGSCDMTNKILPFIGTAQNRNLHFVGLNVVYYLQMTRDAEIRKLAEAIFGMQESTVPEREVVPINIKKGDHQITITSEFDNVDTTLSYIDIFHSDQKFTKKHNLIHVNSGTTVIQMRYPYIIKGLVVTAIGIILSILSYIIMRKMKGCENHEEANQTM